MTASAVAALLVVPAGPALASSDGADAVSALATEASEMLVEEARLLELAGPSADRDPDQVRAASEELREIDGRGQALLIQLTGLGVDLTPAIETALDRLPPPPEAGNPASVPQPVVYDAAISDLNRIAQTPTAVAPLGNGTDGPAYGLLLIAAISLVILGVAALTNTLWRKPDDEDLEAMAWSDGLTGLANRRKLDHDLEANHDAPTAVIMIDVDHFKRINDTFGHQAGDDVLRQCGEVFRQTVRNDDVVYRYGGEEFCVLLPGASDREAQAIGERLVTAARNIELPDATHLTISVGVAGSAGASLEDGVQQADRAMYAAKQQGRDRSISASDGELVAS